MTWVVGFVSLILWTVFTPYVALEQARLLALCLASLCGLFLLSMVDRARKTLAIGRDFHWPGIHGSAA